MGLSARPAQNRFDAHIPTRARDESGGSRSRRRHRARAARAGAGARRLSRTKRPENIDGAGSVDRSRLRGGWWPGREVKPRLCEAGPKDRPEPAARPGDRQVPRPQAQESDSRFGVEEGVGDDPPVGSATGRQRPRRRSSPAEPGQQAAARHRGRRAGERRKPRRARRAAGRRSASALGADASDAPTLERRRAESRRRSAACSAAISAFIEVMIKAPLRDRKIMELRTPAHIGQKERPKGSDPLVAAGQALPRNWWRTRFAPGLCTSRRVIARNATRQR